MIFLVVRAFVTRYAAVLALAFGVSVGVYGARWLYMPTVDRLAGQVADLRTSLAQAQAAALSARKRTDALLAEQKRQAAQHQASVDRLRQELQERAYQNESCDSAALDARRQWLGR